ncbi:tetratricopeptide repeat protein [Treponema sp.]|uniref:tetratricopeptide repeat protein n=1 Tax=Treponema sp. TaxID=166 RepID=UPI00298E7F85|nr:tetratricopeptide repeat protein [Treponema sp.]MCR5613346.1 tetratricopeptide repeat protein [Treponema sp.]
MKKIAAVFLLSILALGAYAQNKKDALVLYYNKNYKESIAICEEEIKSDPNRVDSYVVLCWSLIGNREYARAEQRAYDGLKLSRYDIRLIEVLGEAKFYLGKNDEALKQFQEYISIAPDRTGSRVGVAYYFMGEIYIRQQKFQHADIALSAAVRKDPLSDAWWTRLGYAREMAGNYAESLAAYEEALKLNPSKTDAARGKDRVSQYTR